MPPRKTDRLHQLDRSDSDPLAAKQAPPVEEWKRRGGLAAMGAHFSKQSPSCLEPPSGPGAVKLAKGARLKDLKTLKLWAREVARNYDPIKQGDRASRSSYKALRARLKVPVDEPHLITWARIGIALALTQPEFAPSRPRGRPKGKTLPPGGGQVLADAEKRMQLHLEPFEVALKHSLKEADRKDLVGHAPESFKKRVKRYTAWNRDKTQSELVQLLASAPRQKIGEPNS